MEIPLEFQLFLRILLAAVIGFLIGLERRITGHPAGERTCALAALGACLYTVMSITIAGADPTRIAANVVVGLGFLGAGMILQHPDGAIQGLTTAAGVWAVGAIGVAIGTGAYLIGIGSGGLVLLILISEKLFKLDQRLDARREARRKPKD